MPISNFKDKSIKVIKGGRERYQSSQKALNFIKNKKFKNVFIHDAARPNFSMKLLKKLNNNLKTYKAVVPYIKTEKSTKYKDKNKILNLDRERLLFTQTPQCFDFKLLSKEANMPVFALGGISKDDLKTCMANDGYGVSGISKF